MHISKKLSLKALSASLLALCLLILLPIDSSQAQVCPRERAIQQIQDIWQEDIRVANERLEADNSNCAQLLLEMNGFSPDDELSVWWGHQNELDDIANANPGCSRVLLDFYHCYIPPCAAGEYPSGLGANRICLSCDGWAPIDGPRPEACPDLPPPDPPEDPVECPDGFFVDDGGNCRECGDNDMGRRDGCEEDPSSSVPACTQAEQYAINQCANAVNSEVNALNVYEARLDQCEEEFLEKVGDVECRDADGNFREAARIFQECVNDTPGPTYGACTTARASCAETIRGLPECVARTLPECPRPRAKGDFIDEVIHWVPRCDEGDPDPDPDPGPGQDPDPGPGQDPNPNPNPCQINPFSSACVEACIIDSSKCPPNPCQDDLTDPECVAFCEAYPQDCTDEVCEPGYYWDGECEACPNWEPGYPPPSRETCHGTPSSEPACGAQPSIDACVNEVRQAVNGIHDYEDAFDECEETFLESGGDARCRDEAYTEAAREFQSCVRGIPRRAYGECYSRRETCSNTIESNPGCYGGDLPSCPRRPEISDVIKYIPPCDGNDLDDPDDPNGNPCEVDPFSEECRVACNHDPSFCHPNPCFLEPDSQECTVYCDANPRACTEDLCELGYYYWEGGCMVCANWRRADPPPSRDFCEPQPDLDPEPIDCDDPLGWMEEDCEEEVWCANGKIVDDQEIGDQICCGGEDGEQEEVCCGYNGAGMGDPDGDDNNYWPICELECGERRRVLTDGCDPAAASMGECDPTDDTTTWAVGECPEDDSCTPRPPGVDNPGFPTFDPPPGSTPPSSEAPPELVGITWPENERIESEYQDNRYRDMCVRGAPTEYEDFDPNTGALIDDGTLDEHLLTQTYRKSGEISGAKNQHFEPNGNRYFLGNGRGGTRSCAAMLSTPVNDLLSDDPNTAFRYHLKYKDLIDYIDTSLSPARVPLVIKGRTNSFRRHTTMIGGISSCLNTMSLALDGPKEENLEELRDFRRAQAYNCAAQYIVSRATYNKDLKQKSASSDCPPDFYKDEFDACKSCAGTSPSSGIKECSYGGPWSFFEPVGSPLVKVAHPVAIPPKYCQPLVKGSDALAVLKGEKKEFEAELAEVVHAVGDYKALWNENEYYLSDYVNKAKDLTYDDIVVTRGLNVGKGTFDSNFEVLTGDEDFRLLTADSEQTNIPCVGERKETPDIHYYFGEDEEAEEDWWPITYPTQTCREVNGIVTLVTCMFTMHQDGTGEWGEECSKSFGFSGSCPLDHLGDGRYELGEDCRRITDSLTDEYIAQFLTPGTVCAGGNEYESSEEINYCPDSSIPPSSESSEPPSSTPEIEECGKNFFQSYDDDEGAKALPERYCPNVESIKDPTHPFSPRWDIVGVNENADKVDLDYTDKTKAGNDSLPGTDREWSIVTSERTTVTRPNPDTGQCEEVGTFWNYTRYNDPEGPWASQAEGEGADAQADEGEATGNDNTPPEGTDADAGDAETDAGDESLDKLADPVVQCAVVPVDVLSFRFKSFHKCMHKRIALNKHSWYKYVQENESPEGFEPPCSTKYYENDKDPSKCITEMSVQQCCSILTKPLVPANHLKIRTCEGIDGRGSSLIDSRDHVEPYSDMPFNGALTDYETDLERVKQLNEERYCGYEDEATAETEGEDGSEGEGAEGGADEAEENQVTPSEPEEYLFKSWFRTYVDPKDGKEVGVHMPYMRWWDTGAAAGVPRKYGSFISTLGGYDTIVGVGREAAGYVENGREYNDFIRGNPDFYDRNTLRRREAGNLGGWGELLLHQMYTTRFHNLNCLGRYEQLFKPGDASNFVHYAAGGSFTSRGELLPETPATRGIERRKQGEEWQWPLAWLGYASDEGYRGLTGWLRTNDSGREDVGHRTRVTIEGLDQAQPGDIALLKLDDVYTAVFVEGLIFPEEFEDIIQSTVLRVISQQEPPQNILEYNVTEGRWEVQKRTDGEVIAWARPSAVQVRAPNEGKHPSSAGVTMQWGVGPSRFIFRDTVPSTYFLKEGDGAGVKVTDPNFLAAKIWNEEEQVFEPSCIDSDYTVCVLPNREEDWESTILYRPVREWPQYNCPMPEDNELSEGLPSLPEGMEVPNGLTDTPSLDTKTPTNFFSKCVADGFSPPFAYRSGRGAEVKDGPFSGNITRTYYCGMNWGTCGAQPGVITYGADGTEAVPLVPTPVPHEREEEAEEAE